MKSLLNTTLALIVAASFNAYANDASIDKLTQLETQLKLLQSQLQNEYLPISNNQKQWEIESYGTLALKNHAVFRNTQDTTPNNRTVFDIERAILEFKYHLSPKLEVEIEFEFEHGGTGSALEYDGFEEFGEFEAEIEAGGEVLVEKLEFKYEFSNATAVKFGQIAVPVGIGTLLHKPSDYFTTQRYWSEATILPQTWYEGGLNLTQQIGNWSLQTMISTGLNSEYFRTYNWIANGQQKRFETVNADDLAMTFRAEYGHVKSSNGVGLSVYVGNTSGNRHNDNNIDESGQVTIVSANYSYQYNQWLFRGQYIHGKLSNSQAITQANKTTPGLQPGNFAQLGDSAKSGVFELGYQFEQTLLPNAKVTAFSTYQFANPISSVEQGTATPRFNKSEIAFGANIALGDGFIVKGQVANQHYADDNIDDTQSFSLSVGYQFSI